MPFRWILWAPENEMLGGIGCALLKPPLFLYQSKVNIYSCRSFLQALYITIGQVWSEAFVEIASKVCENEQAIAKSNLAIMDIDIGELSNYLLYILNKYWH